MADTLRRLGSGGVQLVPLEQSAFVKPQSILFELDGVCEGLQRRSCSWGWGCDFCCWHSGRCCSSAGAGGWRRIQPDRCCRLALTCPAPPLTFPCRQATPLGHGGQPPLGGSAAVPPPAAVGHPGAAVQACGVCFGGAGGRGRGAAPAAARRCVLWAGQGRARSTLCMVCFVC